MNWQYIDKQMARWESRLLKEVRLQPDTIGCLATTIAAEVDLLPSEKKVEIKDATLISISDRLNELKALQRFMEIASQIHGDPAVTRAHVIVQNYICFVYLPESCFRIISKLAPNDSATRKCAKFLCNNPIRAFRNALAHANWTYRADYRALIYWSRMGDDRNEPLKRFEVDQESLDFWQHLCKCVAYATYSNL